MGANMDYKFIKDYYQEIYDSHDREGKRVLTGTLNAILETWSPKIMAMALLCMLERGDLGNETTHQ